MTARIVCLAAVLVVAVLFVGGALPAAARDDPSAYTDPAPKPVQEEEAVERVERALRDDGVTQAVTPKDVDEGVVIDRTESDAQRTPRAGAQPPKVAPTEPEGRQTRTSDQPTDRAVVQSAEMLPLTRAGLAPSIRSGVETPSDSVIPDSAPIALAALAAAIAAGALALRRS